MYRCFDDSVKTLLSAGALLVLGQEQLCAFCWCSRLWRQWTWWWPWCCTCVLLPIKLQRSVLLLCCTLPPPSRALCLTCRCATRTTHTFTGLLSFMAVTFNAAALKAGNRGGSSVRDLDGSPLRCVNGDVDGTSLAIGAVLGCVEECAVGSMRKRQICDTLY